MTAKKQPIESVDKPAAAAGPPSIAETIAGYRETEAFRRVISAVVDDHVSLFLTGDAGTGKSTLLRRLIEESRARGRRVAVLAPTGCAAVNVGGQTIHSFFGIPPPVCYAARDNHFTQPADAPRSRHPNYR